MNLKIAQCCGTCIHSNKPKKPEDHTPHYSVAKTERWCYLNKCNTTRECVCENYERDNKKGGVPACKRVFKFNERAERILRLVSKMQEFNIEELNTYGWNPKTFIVNDGWLYRKYYMTRPFTKEKYTSINRVNSKESDFDEIEHELWNDFNKKRFLKGEKDE